MQVSSACRTQCFVPTNSLPAISLGKLFYLLGIPLTSSPTILNEVRLLTIKARCLVTNLSWFETLACLNGGKGHRKDREEKYALIMQKASYHIFQSLPIKDNLSMCLCVPKGPLASLLNSSI